MADLTITAANVALVSGGRDDGALAGEAFTAGMAVYKSSTTGKWMKAQADGTAEEAGSAVAFGIALNTGVLNQPTSVQISGIITMGATVVVGKIYLISAAAGGICPVDDISTSTHRVSVIGIGATSARIDMAMKNYTGYAIP